MRFRTVEDERRYGALRIEMYLRLLHLPPHVAGEVLRNWSKIEALLYWEGVRQGLAIAALNGMDERPNPDRVLFAATNAVRCHAAVYGDADTPLCAVEAKHMAAIFADAPLTKAAAELHPWLSTAPVEFAPQTLAEVSRRHVGNPQAGDEAPPVLGATAPQVAPPPLTGGFIPQSVLDEDLMRLMAQEDLAAEERDDDQPPQSPDFLDRVRDELRDQLGHGWKPSGWPDLIMRLHMAMHVDASYLDLQLSSDNGRAVLAQVGLFDIFPGLGVMVNDGGAFAGIREG